MQPHGFFHKTPWREKTLLRTDEFLVSLKYLGRKATIVVLAGKDGKPSRPFAWN
jgi:hypothetical protein